MALKESKRNVVENLKEKGESWRENRIVSWSLERILIYVYIFTFNKEM